MLEWREKLVQGVNKSRSIGGSVLMADHRTAANSAKIMVCDEHARGIACYGMSYWEDVGIYCANSLTNDTWRTLLFW
jgi:hypothetical protein